MRFNPTAAGTAFLIVVAAWLAAPATTFAQYSAGTGAQSAPVCANCHEAQWKAIDLSAHGAKNDAGGSMCQACHGDASEHLKDPTKKPANPFGKGHTAD